MNMMPQTNDEFEVELPRRTRSRSDLPQRQTRTPVVPPSTGLDLTPPPGVSKQSFFGRLKSFFTGEEPVRMARERVQRVRRHDAETDSNTAVVTQTVHSSVLLPQSKDLLRRFRVGTRIAGSEIEDVIGFGAHGVVLKARDHVSGEDVAVKVLGRPEDQLATRGSDFEMDLTLLQRVNHPGILPLREVGAAGGYRYLKYRLFLGREELPLTVEDYARMFGSVLDQWNVQRIFLFLLEAAAAAHVNLSYHLDLKPSNILMTMEGEVGSHGSCVARLKYSDWGLVTALGTEAYARAIAAYDTRREPGAMDAPDHTSMRESLEFMAPELRARGETGPQADIYSLGLILRQLLTGVRGNIIVQPTSVKEDLHVGWNEIVKRAIHPNTRKRYRTMAEFADAVQNLEL